MMDAIHASDALETWRREHQLDPALVRHLRASLLRKFAGLDQALQCLPAAARADFLQAFRVHPLALAGRRDSELDGATKLLFRTAEGLLLESVILRVTSGRTSLCVSSQVGCRARCEFCATGRMDVVKNLSAEEILDQVVQCGQLIAAEGRRLRNVVFMGMGEPLHNEAELHRALAALVDPREFNLHPARIMLSTVGIPAGMVRLATAWPELRLAVSLHSVRPEVRRKLMPISERHGLDALHEAICEVTRVQRRAIMIEYLLLADENDTDEDMRLLVEYLRDVDVHVNLIPYNAIEEAPHLAGSSPERCREFALGLKGAGLRVTTRYSLGADVAAACGQLIRQGQRRQVSR